jgi:hypothetical protein
MTSTPSLPPNPFPFPFIETQHLTVSNLSSSFSANVPYQTTASWRAMRKHRQELYDSGPVNDGKNDNLTIIGVAAVNLCSFLSTQYLYAIVRQ